MSTTVIASFVLVCFVPPLILSAVATGLMRRWAAKLGLVDQPGERKVHKEPTPLGGGIGIWLGVIVPLAAAQLAVVWLAGSEERRAFLPTEIGVDWEAVLARSGQLWAVLLGGTVLAAMGLLDDLKPRSWKLRLAVQFCLAVAVVAPPGGTTATVFVGPYVGMALTVLWIMVLVNAFNFLDNMDGLSSGVALIAAVIFAAVMLTSTGQPRWLVGGVLLVLAGSVAGFLVFHNWPPAKIFMGDAGSCFLGWMLACLTVMGTFYESDLPSRHVILAPLCVLAVPLYDFCSVVIIRLREGRSPFQPDKKHFSHRLVELGLQPRNAVLTIHLATLTTGIGALLLYRVKSWTGAGLIVTLVGCVLAIVAILETAGRNSKVK
jgi:UDP-GlcNAc:undecaprenyl-phosphate/decaprenyl-phosphate GlcNAc-1-phosphate transferase